MPTPNSELESEKFSDDEIAYRRKHYSDIKAVEDEQITCTSCKKLLDISVEKVFAHPLLKTLQCKDCFNFIKKKEESEKKGSYCRMCGIPDSLHACKNDKCSHKFCRKCVLAHLNLSLKDLKAQNWLCFICNIKSLWELRAICSAVLNSFPKGLKKNMSTRRASKQKKNIVEQVSRSKDLQRPRIKPSTSSNTSDKEYIESTQTNSTRKSINGFEKSKSSKSSEINNSRSKHRYNMNDERLGTQSDDGREKETRKNRRPENNEETDNSSGLAFETKKSSSSNNRKSQGTRKDNNKYELGTEKSQEEYLDVQIDKIWNALIRNYRDNQTIVEYIKQTYHDRRNKSFKSVRHYIEKSQNLIIKFKESLNEREKELLALSGYWKSNFQSNDRSVQSVRDNDRSSVNNFDSSTTEGKENVVSDFSSDEIFSNEDNNASKKPNEENKEKSDVSRFENTEPSKRKNVNDDEERRNSTDSNGTAKLDNSDKTNSSESEKMKIIDEEHNELSDKTALLRSDSSSEESGGMKKSLPSNNTQGSKDSDSTEDGLEKRMGKVISSSESNNEEERGMKKSLLGSDSNDRTTEVDEEQEIKKGLLESDSNEEPNVQSSTLKTCPSDESFKMINDQRNLSFKSNDHSYADKKLQMKCQVESEKLPQSILINHMHAIEKSKLFLDCIKIKSLVNLDRLEKKSSTRVKVANKSRPKSKTKSKEKEEEETLLDHLKKVENGEMDGRMEISNDDTDLDSSVKINEPPKTKENLLLEADRVHKDLLLNTSDSDVGNSDVISDQNVPDGSSVGEKAKAKNDKDSNVSSEENKNDQDRDVKENKPDWRKNKLLTMKFSDSDTDVENDKLDKSLEKKRNSIKKNESQSDSDSDNEKILSKRRKHLVKRRVLDSDSDIKLTDCEEDSSDVMSDTIENLKNSEEHEKKMKEKPRKRHVSLSSYDSESSNNAKRSKPKRKRIQNVSSDSDIEITNPSSSFNKGRKNIRKVLKDTHMTQDTQQAAKEEEERLKRISDRQKMYNSMCEAKTMDGKKIDSLVLDFNPETKEKLMSVDEKLAKQLKPHQAKGVQFMWDACFESVDRLKTSNGSGCIIAHCMGLGKTLQVITLAHTVLTDERTGVETVMIVCPLNTVLNWVNEFHMWLRDVENADDIEIYELTKFKKHSERQYVLTNWKKTGGVLIIGYEMFRNLIKGGKNVRKKMQESIVECLLDPGPDLVVCDEGHLLKNEDTALSKSMRRVKTLRRIILTGTPLQNNLKEYHCMVQFVKPNLLGTRNEFLNRFVNPITNGQFDNSTAYDVKVMKKRAHVLHKMLEGCVQRFDYLVLRPFLPPKHEYVIYVKLTEVQVKMYQYYLDNYARTSRGAGGSLFADFQGLQRIWTHPMVLQMNSDKIGKMNEKRNLTSDSEGSLRDFIDDDDESNSSSSSDMNDKGEKSKRSTRNNPTLEIEIPREDKTDDTDWWLQFVEPEQLQDIRISTKLVLLFAILKECEEIGDKVLVFSQSLFSLTLIEKFLRQIDDETQKTVKSKSLNGQTGSWAMGLDYFRLDGQTSADNRNQWCKIFNRPTNTRARLFLISTRAGGLGINLTAANRVIIFDASWNPSHDLQSIFRVYRFGQKKPSYVYRFLAAGTMEEKIYNRQVTKLSLACRVIDEQQIERHYSNTDLNELYRFEPIPNSESTLHFPSDRLLAEILSKHKQCISNCLEHDSLLENKADEGLDEEDRKQAWLEYEEEKKGKLKPIVQPAMPLPMMNYPNLQEALQMQQQHNMMLNASSIIAFNDILTSMNLNYASLKEMIRKDYPHATPTALDQLIQKKVMLMYEYTKQQSVNNMLAQGMISGRAMIVPRVNNHDNYDDEIIEIPSGSNQSSMHSKSKSIEKKHPQLED